MTSSAALRLVERYWVVVALSLIVAAIVALGEATGSDRIVVTMNEMLSRIQAGHDAQRRFVGDASHELRSPLTTVLAALELGLEHPGFLDHDLLAGTLLPEGRRMRHLIDDTHNESDLQRDLEEREEVAKL